MYTLTQNILVRTRVTSFSLKRNILMKASGACSKISVSFDFPEGTYYAIDVAPTFSVLH